MGGFLASKSIRASWLVLCLLAVASSKVAADEHPLVVGVLPTLSPRVLLGNYQPFRIYLEQALKQPVEMVTAKNFTVFHQNTMAGHYDMVVTAAHLARLAQVEGRFVPLATYQSTNRALLMTSKAAPLKSIAQLRGQTVATLDRYALIASQTVLWLEGKQLQLGKDYRLLETSSHNSAAYSVLSGESALAIVAPAGLKQMPRNIQQGLQTFASLPPLPAVMWLANPRISSEVPRLKAVLLAFSPQLPEGKQFFDKTGYQSMREITEEEMESLDLHLPYLKQHLGQ